MGLRDTDREGVIAKMSVALNLSFGLFAVRHVVGSVDLQEETSLALASPNTELAVIGRRLG